MLKIGILTCAKCVELAPRDQHLLPLFAANEIQADILIWDNPQVDWAAYDGLLFRSVWDYHLRGEEFTSWLTRLEEHGIKTLNPVPVIKQNQHKFYLRELESKGVAIVPTYFIDKTDALDLSVLANNNWQRAVIKPAVSASSYLTTLFNVADWKRIEAEYTAVAKTRDLLLQPFMAEIVEAGEVSLIFFNRKYSHAVLKRAPVGDFRVQAEFGGSHESITPSNEVIETAEHILSLISGDLLYARVDGLMQNGRFILMELELLEPDLYFDAHPEASNRYTQGIRELLG